jgi:hypothetical protein
MHSVDRSACTQWQPSPWPREPYTNAHRKSWSLGCYIIQRVAGKWDCFLTSSATNFLDAAIRCHQHNSERSFGLRLQVQPSSSKAQSSQEVVWHCTTKRNRIGAYCHEFTNTDVSYSQCRERAYLCFSVSLCRDRSKEKEKHHNYVLP